jgi:hypothetical protein
LCVLSVWDKSGKKVLKKLLAEKKKLLTFATLFGRNGRKKLEIDRR